MRGRQGCPVPPPDPSISRMVKASRGLYRYCNTALYMLGGLALLRIPTALSSKASRRHWKGTYMRGAPECGEGVRSNDAIARAPVRQRWCVAQSACTIYDV